MTAGVGAGGLNNAWSNKLVFELNKEAVQKRCFIQNKGTIILSELLLITFLLQGLLLSI